MAINVSEKPRLPIENTGEQHLACAVLIDTSGSMQGYEKDIRNAIAEMKEAIENDDIARGRVEICLITFDDDVREESSFSNISRLVIPRIKCDGMTSTHAAITFALKRVRDRKDEYKQNQMTYNQPWIWLLTDGGSNDRDNGSFAELLKEQRDGKCVFFGIAIGDNVNEAELSGMHKDGMILKIGKNNLATAFEFISKSVITTSSCTPGSEFNMAVPNGMDVQFIKINA